MNGREFVRRAQRYARKNSFDFRYYPNRGKGSHGEVHVGEFRTTVKYGEIPPGLLANMLKDLDIDRKEF